VSWPSTDGLHVAAVALKCAIERASRGQSVLLAARVLSPRKSIEMSSHSSGQNGQVQSCVVAGDPVAAPEKDGTGA
jgi:hypothetical protein